MTRIMTSIKLLFSNTAALFAFAPAFVLVPFILAGCCAPSVIGGAAPNVLSVSPAATSNTACPAAVIAASFSEALNPASINATDFTVRSASGPIAGAVTYTAANNTAAFTPSAVLLAGTTYTVGISTAVVDAYGNPLAAPYTYNFTTAANGCHPAPALLSLTPSSTCPNASVTATFSEAMNPLTVNAQDFTLSNGVIGTVTHNAANTAFTLTPSSSLAAGTQYTATVTTAAQDTYGNPLPAPGVTTFTTATNSCMPAPTVIATVPAAAATGVCPNRVITATFSEAMAPATINNSTFTVSAGGAALAGTVSYSVSSKSAIFTPSASLPLNTTFTGTVTTGVQDLYGNNLAAPYTFTFATGANTCLPPAPPLSVTPAAGSTGICTAAVVSATFPQAMNPASVNATTFTLTTGGGPALPGTITADSTGKTYTLTPTAMLLLSTTYTATFTTGVTDTFGNALASPYTFSFTTAAVPCGTVTPGKVTPVVTALSPQLNAMGVCTNALIVATFNEPINPATLTNASFSLSPFVAGTVTLDSTGEVATLTPGMALALNTTYIVTLYNTIKDLNGNPLAANYTSTFTTALHACQQPVPLGTAANFEVLAGSTVTSTGGTVITGGDLGLTPGSSVTGFPPGTLTLPATMHITDAVAAQAQLDLTVAYNYAAGLPGAAMLPADLTGLTLTPGLYGNASTVTLSNGSVTLDAQGNANAIFIFQVGSSLSTLPNTQIILTGGAQAKNIYWQVGSSATLGVNSTFKGTIMALQSISIATGASLQGRALARNGAVTMDSNAITAP